MSPPSSAGAAPDPAAGASTGAAPDPAPETPTGEEHQPEADDASPWRGAMAGAAADEQALLDAFERLSPQGSLRWGFDDAMRRLAHPETDVAVTPWAGLPENLWERGRSARLGGRFVGDVAGVMAELLAADARAVAAATAAAVNVATWDALRYLAARVEQLETSADPVRLEAAELPLTPPDLGAHGALIGSLLGRPGAGDYAEPLLVGECGDGALPRWLRASGWRVEGVEPRGATVWAGLSADNNEGTPEGAPEHTAEGTAAEGTAAEGRKGADRRTRSSSEGHVPAPNFVMAEMLDYLKTAAPAARPGVVLAGCVDRLGLPAKVAVLAEAIRITAQGGTVVVVATNQTAWDESLDPPARDLAPGRPLHPDTWVLLMKRAGLSEVTWHHPESGVLEVITGRVQP